MFGPVSIPVLPKVTKTFYRGPCEPHTWEACRPT